MSNQEKPDVSFKEASFSLHSKGARLLLTPVHNVHQLLAGISVSCTLGLLFTSCLGHGYQPAKSGAAVVDRLAHVPDLHLCCPCHRILAHLRPADSAAS